MNRLILASSSTARLSLLKNMGFVFDVCASNIKEFRKENESATSYVQRLAAEKADFVFTKLGESDDLVVLAADTVVCCDNEVLEKPQDKNDFIRMMRLLSNNTHNVFTGFCVLSNKAKFVELVTSSVVFCALTDQQIDAYWATGEPVNKAGGYGIQGVAGGFIKSIQGSYSSIVGLPLVEVREALSKQGVACAF